jgi:hypothetical protein
LEESVRSYKFETKLSFSINVSIGSAATPSQSSESKKSQPKTFLAYELHTMSTTIFKNYWPTLLLSSVLVAGLIICLKRIDFLAIEEVNALISIIFGSATSCLM